MSIHFNHSFAQADAVKSSAWGPYRGSLKRVLDLVLVAVFALPVLVILAVLSLIIMFDGSAPIYLQKRVGRNGQIFKMWKLRTMVPNAEARLEKHLLQNPQAKSEWDQMQKLRHDPRVTRIGRLIRKTSLDELPQLWNVIRGEMSIVGPRPMMENQVGIYPGVTYYSMRPGLTGYWQISKRNECSFAQRAFFDNQYFHEQSLRTDLNVMMATVVVIFRATGQ